MLPSEYFYKNLPKDRPMVTTCWIWQGSKDAYGYGQAYLAGYSRKAHRLAWQIFNGDIPSGFCICHSCDVRSCVNPLHLFLGSVADNMRDMTAKGRNIMQTSPWLAKTQFGERNGSSKLTDAQRFQIWDKRTSGVTQFELAKEFGVSQSTISKVIGRRIMKAAK